MWTLIWAAIIATAQGPVRIGPVAEPHKFKTEQECSTYFTTQEQRFADYARGAAGLDFPDEVRMFHICKQEGQST